MSTSSLNVPSDWAARFELLCNSYPACSPSQVLHALTTTDGHAGKARKELDAMLEREKAVAASKPAPAGPSGLVAGVFWIAPEDFAMYFSAVHVVTTQMMSKEMAGGRPDGGLVLR